MSKCQHHYILEGHKPYADGKCKKCGVSRNFTGGWSKDDLPIGPDGKVIPYFEGASKTWNQ